MCVLKKYFFIFISFKVGRKKNLKNNTTDNDNAHDVRMSSCVAVACWISEHPAIGIRIFNNNIANPVKWFSALACCSSGNCGSGGCGPDP